MDTIDILAQNQLVENQHKRLAFVLKLFCFEIDLDSATDVTVERNKQFLHHAVQLLTSIEPPSGKEEYKNFGDEVQFTFHIYIVQ